MSTLFVLWDDSSLWGLLAARAVAAFSVSYRFVTGVDIAQGILQEQNPAMLLVPGGNARGKSLCLGAKGRQAIRQYIQDGGHYIGFCGGAGLALTWVEKDSTEGLSLCPWKRGVFGERMQHFMSGHLYVRLNYDAKVAHTSLFPEGFSDKNKASRLEPLLPVWWPGRFEPHGNTDTVTVLASYAKPGPDFWLTDLLISKLPPNIFESWHNLYGLSVSPTYLENQPCVIHGHFGKGSYILSYSHLETPDSAFANTWLAHIFTCTGNLSPASKHIPPWDLENVDIVWDDPILAQVEEDLRIVTKSGLEHGLLFKRNEWLLGWRTGIPGANLNSLLATIRVIRRTEPCAQAEEYWSSIRKDIQKNAALFQQAGVEYLLSERLAQTLAKVLPEAVPQSMLRDRRNALFGSPMQVGGVYQALIEPLDKLAFLQLKNMAAKT